MNKVKLLLSLSLCFGLVACESKENQEDNPPEIVNQLDRTQADYTIEEIEIPKEFHISEETDGFISMFHEGGYDFKVTRNNENSRMLPVDTIYDYNLLTNKLALIDSPIEADGYRVLSHVVDEFGGEYDLIEYVQGDQRYKRVFYNGELVEEIENNIDNPFFSRGFQKINDGVYIFAETAGKTEDKSIWSLYKLNQGKAETLFKYDNQINDEYLKEGTRVVLPPIQQTSKNRIAYSIVREGVEYFQLFDGDELTEIEVSVSTPTIIPLEDNVLYYNQVPIDLDNGKFKYELFQYDLKTKTTKQIDTLDSDLGLTYHTQGNEFYFTTISGEDKNSVCKVENDKLTCRTLKGFSGLYRASLIANLDNKTDFMLINDHNDSPHFYLIHWQ